MSKTYIEKEAALSGLCSDCKGIAYCRVPCALYDYIDDFPSADVKPVPAGGIGEMSDGYHTFNGLYYQRMILFAALVKAYKDRAWKSYRHEDGELCFGGGWFIVGIDTPAGSYTYHYENKHFDLFECKELPAGKHWDGHTEKDVTRLLKLEPAVPHEMSAREYEKALDRAFRSDDDAYGEWADAIDEGNKDKAVAIIEKWAREHSEKRHKTYAEDFFEKFPNAEPKYYDGRGKEQMIPIPCRQHCYGVVGQKCNGIGCSCSACWNEEMEDADE